NLIWAFAYNVLMIPLTVAGRVSPVVAAAAMAGSSVTVVGNALRLRLYGVGRGRAALSADGGDTAKGDWRIRLAPPLRSLPNQAHAPDPVHMPELLPSSVPAEAAPPEGHVSPANVPAAPSSFARQEVKRILRALGRLFEKQWEI
ncbi:MAG TPA: hypothetical protein VF972_07550, partial [Actinomycetota bacterium]